jgi:hypothetical protein
VFADDPAHGISIPLTNCIVNNGGFGQVQVDFSGFAQGTYHVNAVIAGATADSYGGTWAITVGR